MAARELLPENKRNNFGYIPARRNSHLGVTAEFMLRLRFIPYRHLPSHRTSDPAAGCYAA